MQKRYAGHGQEKLLPIGTANLTSAIEDLARRYWSTTADINYISLNIKSMFKNAFNEIAHSSVAVLVAASMMKFCENSKKPM